MARIVDSFPARTGSRYPWPEWLDGRIWELERGVDFTASPTSIRTSAMHAATRRGIKVRVSQKKNKVYVQALVKQAVASEPLCRNGILNGKEVSFVSPTA